MTERDAEPVLGETTPSLTFCSVALRDGPIAFPCTPYPSARVQFLSTDQKPDLFVRFGGLALVNSLLVLWDRLFQQPDPVLHARSKFIRALSVGSVDAIGYCVPRTPDACPVLIPSHVWENADLDWNRAEVAGAGFEFTHVRILVAHSYFDSRQLQIFPEPLPELDRFAPSDAKFDLLALPTRQEDADKTRADREDAPNGRPSHKKPILQAYDAIEKDPTWSNKQLAYAIREHVKKAEGLFNDRGLSEDTILGHLKDLWIEFRDRKT